MKSFRKPLNEFFNEECFPEFLEELGSKPLCRSAADKNVYILPEYGIGVLFQKQLTRSGYKFAVECEGSDSGVYEFEKLMNKKEDEYEAKKT